MKIVPPKSYASHGTGELRRELFRALGADVVFEPGVLVFHPENIAIGRNVYVGHNAVLKGYYQNLLSIGDHTWIGQGCFLHSAGGIAVGRAVGIGPMVKILTSEHDAEDCQIPVLFSALRLLAVTLGDGCDIGIGATVLPGVTVGEGAIVGAGAVVTRDVPAYEVWAGNPARKIRDR